MKEWFLIRDTLTNKISYYHLALFLVCLPFDRLYSELVLISLTLHTMIHFKKEDAARLRSLPLLLLFGSARALDLLSLGEEPAQSLGLDAIRARRLVYLTTSLLTAVSVAVCTSVLTAVRHMVPRCKLIQTSHLCSPWCSWGEKAKLAPQTVSICLRKT